MIAWVCEMSGGTFISTVLTLKYLFRRSNKELLRIRAMKRLFKSVHFIYMFVLLIWQFLICAANLAISQFPKFAWMRMCVCAQVVTDVAGDFLD